MTDTKARPEDFMSNPHQKRPGAVEQFRARVHNAIDQTPKAKAQAAEDKARRAAVERGRARMPKTREAVMAAKMYPKAK